MVEERVRAGLPGCAIQWGGIGDVGVLADTLGDVEVGLKFFFSFNNMSILPNINSVPIPFLLSASF